jgi:hypothetical protein
VAVRRLENGEAVRDARLHRRDREELRPRPRRRHLVVDRADLAADVVAREADLEPLVRPVRSRAEAADADQALDAIRKLRLPENVAELRGKTVEELR